MAELAMWSAIFLVSLSVLIKASDFFTEAAEKIGLAMLFIFLGADYTVESVIRLAEILDIGKEIIAVSAVALGTSLYVL